MPAHSSTTTMPSSSCSSPKSLIHKKKYPCRHLDCEKSYNDAPNRRKHEIGPYHPACAPTSGHCKRCEKARLKFLCSKCGKSLASNQSVRRHEQICKVIAVKKETTTTTTRTNKHTCNNSKVGSMTSSVNKKKVPSSPCQSSVPSTPTSIVSSPIASSVELSTEIPLTPMSSITISQPTPTYMSATTAQLLQDCLFVPYETTTSDFFLAPATTTVAPTAITTKIVTTSASHSDVLPNFMIMQEDYPSLVTTSSLERSQTQQQFPSNCFTRFDDFPSNMIEYFYPKEELFSF